MRNPPDYRFWAFLKRLKTTFFEDDLAKICIHTPFLSGVGTGNSARNSSSAVFSRLPGTQLPEYSSV